jgi:MFS family permease
VVVAEPEGGNSMSGTATTTVPSSDTAANGAGNVTIGKKATGIDRAHRRIILAASLGTVFEWYDFYLYGSLAAVIGKHFFAAVNQTTAFIFALLAFSAGFAVRPLGALVFGRLGDRSGRKHTFLITIVVMGLATAAVGFLPTYDAIGIAAPVLLIGLRLLQGLAVGGEYGGAAIYVAEHAPPERRAYYTSFIQLTATAGLVLSLLVILACRMALGPEFDVWGWRVPFMLSILLLGISIYIRLQLEESPVFHEMRKEGRLSKRPIAESFARWGNLKLVLLALFGAMTGQAVVGYCGLVYMLLFLTQTLKVEPVAANVLVMVALGLCAPFYLVFGRLADRIGRKPLVIVGCVLAGLSFFPLFAGLTRYANPAIETAQRTHPITVVADPGECSFQFDPIGKAHFTTSCDVVKTALTSLGVPYANQAAAPGTIASVQIGRQSLSAFDGGPLAAAAFRTRSAEFKQRLLADLSSAGYPSSADPARVDYPMVLLLLFLIGLCGVMTYAPIAAWLVELFPPQIRYTSMSLPYHIGNGWFGGFVPTIAFAMIAYTGNMYSGLWYVVAVCALTVVVGGLFLQETNGRALER